MRARHYDGLLIHQNLKSLVYELSMKIRIRANDGRNEDDR